MEQAENEVIQNEEPSQQPVINEPQVADLANDWDEVDPNEKQDDSEGDDEEPDDSGDKPDESEGEESEDPDDGEEEFYFGDEKLESLTSAEEKDTGLVKDLRNVIKEKEKELKELRRVAAIVPAQVSIELPPEPTLEDADYDEVVFKQKWLDWNGRKQQADELKQRREAQQEEFNRLHNEKLSKYAEAKRDVKFKDYDIAEKIVIEEVPVELQNAIIHHSSNPTLVVMALGRSSQLRNELANAKDPIAVGRLLERIETKAKAMPKGKKPAAKIPEVKSQGGVSRRTSADVALSKVLPDAVFK